MLSSSTMKNKRDRENQGIVSSPKRYKKSTKPSEQKMKQNVEQKIATVAVYMNNTGDQTATLASFESFLQSYVSNDTVVIDCDPNAVLTAFVESKTKSPSSATIYSSLQAVEGLGMEEEEIKSIPMTKWLSNVHFLAGDPSMVTYPLGGRYPDENNLVFRRLAYLQAATVNASTVFLVLPMGIGYSHHNIASVCDYAICVTSTKDDDYYKRLKQIEEKKIKEIRCSNYDALFGYLHRIALEPHMNILYMKELPRDLKKIDLGDDMETDIPWC
jgi:hypothetical protein